MNLIARTATARLWIACLLIAPLLSMPSLSLQLVSPDGQLQYPPSGPAETPDPELMSGLLTKPPGQENNADLRLSITDNPDPATAGSLLEYTIQIKNNGPALAQDAVLTDPLPAGVTYRSSNAACLDIGGVLACSVGSVPTGGPTVVRITVEIDDNFTGYITNTATISSATPDPNLSNNTSSQETIITSENVDLSVSITESSDPVLAGTALRYTLNAANAGPADATSVLLSDTLPPGASFSSASPGCTAVTSGSVSCTLDVLPAGSDHTFTIDVNVSSSFLGNLQNTAEISSAEFDFDDTNNRATISTTVQAKADLKVVKTESPDPVLASQSLTYSIVVDNQGPSDAVNVVISDTLPSGTVYQSSSAGCNLSGNTLTCTRSRLSAGETATIPVITHAPASGGTITNRVKVSSATDDPNPVNNTASENTAVTAVADIRVTKTASKTQVLAGQQLGYQVTVLNNGPSVAHNITLIDTLPAGVTHMSSPGCSYASQKVTCNITSLAKGAQTSFNITVQVNNSTRDNVVNTVAASADELDNQVGNNSAQVSTVVTTQADLTLNKNAPATVHTGESFTYAIQVTNQGPHPAENVRVTDNLPTGVLLEQLDPGCSASGSVVTCQLGTLNPGSEKEVNLGVRALGQLGILTNTATVTSGTPEVNANNNTDSVQTEVKASSEVAIVIGAMSVAPLESTLKYYLYVDTIGPQPAQNVIVVDTLPVGVAFVSASPGCVYNAGKVTCTLGTLMPGNVVTLEVNVITPNVTGTITNIAVVTSDTDDPVLGNNQDSFNTLVTRADNELPIRTYLPVVRKSYPQP